MQLQIKQASRPRPHHHATSKQKYCMQNVLVSLQICEIKNQKEWHWPQKKKKDYSAYTQTTQNKQILVS
jgi:hypothetical protein